MVTSGWQASKVFDGAISNDDSTDTGASTKSSGGGCVYNPNAPARFVIGFILLMAGKYKLGKKAYSKKAPFSRGFFLCLLYLLIRNLATTGFNSSRRALTFLYAIVSHFICGFYCSI
jgi:hypothetical protein